MSQPIFNSTEQALSVGFNISARLTALVVWTMFAVAHLAVGFLALALLWWFQVTPAATATWISHALESPLPKTYATLGGSVLAIAAGYLWILRRVHRWAGSGLVFDYLLKGVVQR